MALKGDTVKEYLENFPDTPTRTLANMVYAENVKLFTDYEDARAAIRYHRGQQGEGHRNMLTDKRFIRKGEINPFDKIPPGIKQFDDFEPYVIEGENVLNIGDIHIPFHVKEALVLALEYGKEREVDTILLNGDIADFYEQSKFIKDPRLIDFKGSRNALITFLTVLRDEFPDAEIIYKLGNHEERYEIKFKVKAPEYIGIPMFDFEHVIESEKNGIVVVKEKRTVKFGRLNIIHGHEFKGGNPHLVNPARWLFLKGNAMALCNHFHASSSHGKKSMEDKPISTWSSACLCDLHPEWLPHNDWNLGFSHIMRAGGENFQLVNNKIIDGKIYTA